MAKRKKSFQAFEDATVQVAEQVTIDPELQSYIPPLSEQEFDLLTESLKAEGCREPLTVWRNEGRYLLVDGHNRYRICKEHGIDFSVEVLNFSNREAVREWMLVKQLGRRNLTRDSLAYLRGTLYNLRKQLWGGERGATSQNATLTDTASDVAEDFGISRASVFRDAEYARGLDAIGTANPALKAEILSGQAKVRKSDIQRLGKLEPVDLPAMETADELREYLASLAPVPQPKAEPPSSVATLARAAVEVAQMLSDAPGTRTKQRIQQLLNLAQQLQALTDSTQNAEGPQKGIPA